MKNALLPKLLFLFVPCALAVTGCASHHAAAVSPAQSASSAAPALPAAAATLASIPTPPVRTASDHGIANWTRVLRQDPSDDKNWVKLGDTLMQKSRETADPRYYGCAEQVYQQALARNPNSADGMTGMAWVTSSRNQFDKSTDWASKAVAVNPQDNMAYGLLGDADAALGHYNDAYAQYQKMLDIRPDIASYSRGAHLLYQDGDSRKAMWLMIKAIKTGSPYAENTAWCRTQLSLMLFNQGALLPAEQTLGDTLKTSPHNALALATMGQFKAARGNYPEAISFYKKSVAIAPDMTSLTALGDLYQLTGNKAAAEQQYAAVETLHTQNAAAGIDDHMQMAQFDADHNRNLPEALQLADQNKSSLNINDADTLAWCLYKNGRVEEAKAAIQTALSRRSSDAGILYHAGMIYAKAGDRVTAGKCLSHALSTNPYFSPVGAKTAADTLKQLGSHPPNAVAKA
ncbi:MAG: tetratricopeptide repeat protein [Janthinobacterium lividum]